MLTTIDINNIQAVIFDFDGVIVDTERGRYLALEIILKKRGFQPLGLDINSFFGIPTDVFLRKQMPSLTDSDIAEIVRERRAMLLSNVTRYCSLCAGSQAFIENLQALGILTILATTNSHDVLEILIEKLGIAQWFDSVYSREFVMPHSGMLKNYPRVVKAEHLSPDRCIVIEDSCFGIESALQAGLFCVGIHNKCDNTTPNLKVADYTELGSALNMTAP